MTSHSLYYEKNLYPLQDGVLNVLAHCNVPFYLSGGTALSRAYYSHRYSDDLDFFTNTDANYRDEVDLVFAKLREAGFSWKESSDEFIKAVDFHSIKVRRNTSDFVLKLDFVNDCVPHFGDIQARPLFHRVDPIRNILSNKLGAIFRFAGKDIADIREIALHESFNWHDIVQEAQQKDAGVDCLPIGEILRAMPQSAFNDIVWQNPVPSWDMFIADIQQIVRDMLNCGANSLAALN